MYLAPNPTSCRIGTRHSAKDVSHWSWFFIDIDPIADGGVPERALDEALLWLGEWSGRNLVDNKPLILDSGRGMQAWIRLDDWELEYELEGGEQDDRHKVQRSMRYWLHRLDDRLGVCHGCRVDTTCSDLPRVMRCPGTINRKTKRMAKILNKGINQPGLGYLLVTGTPTHLFVEPEPQGNCEGKPWQYAVAYMTMKAKTFLIEGWEEPGRHDALWHTAKKFQELGITRDQADLALRHGNEMCRPEPLEEKDIQHALNTAFGRK